ncbi:MAG: DUF2490 domain-containing protein [Polyangiales bacterium]
MRKGQLFLLVACITAFALVPHAARAQTDQEFGIWGGLFVTGQVRAKAPSLTSWFDAQGRREANSSTVILRPGIGYQIRPWISVWLGYAWVSVFTDATGTRANENRIWEQLTLDYRNIPGLLLQSRTRFEQRFAYGDVGHRYRQAARLNYQPKSSFPLGLVLWDEVFVGMGGSVRWTDGFDQNRLFVGPAVFAFDGMFRTEVGYQFVYLSREVNRSVHLLVINFFVNLRGKR